MGPTDEDYAFEAATPQTFGTSGGAMHRDGRSRETDYSRFLGHYGVHCLLLGQTECFGIENVGL
jgi:hypothetical protein